MKYGLQRIGRSGATNAARASAKPPKSICQAANASGSIEDLVNNRLAITVPVAHEKPASVASSAAFIWPLLAVAPKIKASPMPATAVANHSSRDGLSPSSGQAISTTQNGMV